MTTYQPPTPSEFRDMLTAWGLSQAAAARLTNLTVRQISRYANNPKHPCSYPVLYTLANRSMGIQLDIDWRA